MSELALNEEQQGEIRATYRQAKHKTAQVKILSELYGISTGEICAIIGIDDPCKKKATARRKRRQLSVRSQRKAFRSKKSAANLASAGRL